MGDVIGDLNSRRGLVGEFLDKPGNMRVCVLTNSHMLAVCSSISLLLLLSCTTSVHVHLMPDALHMPALSYPCSSAAPQSVGQADNLPDNIKVFSDTCAPLC